MKTREAVIITGTRTAVGKAKRGTSNSLRPELMGATVIKALLDQVADKLPADKIEDVILGCAMPEGAQGLNIARLVSLAAGLPSSVPAVTVNRFCSSGLQTIAQACERVIANGADAIIAGGVETMSLVPMTGFRFSPDATLASNLPAAYMNMGLTAERIAEKYHISRAKQDAFALRSHQRAASAVDKGFFAAEITPINFEEVIYKNGKTEKIQRKLTLDEHLRKDTSLDSLSKLPTSFKKNGSVTPGNSSPLADGAAVVLVMERSYAESLGLIPKLKFINFAVAGVPPEVMGIGPIRAVPKALKRANLNLKDIDLIELNEAFAAQSLTVINALNLDESILNVNGGAIALGHPLGATGAKLTIHLMHELQRRQGKYGLITMCVGGGQGAAGIFERI